jgi:hypothetical protein
VRPDWCHRKAQLIRRFCLLIALNLWNNSALTNLRRLLHAEFTSYADPGLKMREHLCPTCGWNCAMNELLERLEKSPAKCKAFADDLAMIVRGKNLKKVLQQAQKAMNIAADWASSIGVEFSTTKTMAMLFTRKRKKSYQSPG